MSDLHEMGIGFSRNPDRSMRMMWVMQPLKLNRHLPYRLRKFIVASWNKMACRVWGHDYTLLELEEAGMLPKDHEITCLYCCTPLDKDYL